jgi:hypothetical protein
MKLNIVPARTGLLWVRVGIATYFRQPIALTGLFLMFMALMSMISFIPEVGGILGLLFIPSATLGLMSAAQEAHAGKFPRPLNLFIAFRFGKDKSRQMLLLGVYYTVGFLALLGLSSLWDGGNFARMYLIGTELTKETVLQSDFQNAMWFTLAMYVPFSCLFWHAPALVHWHGISVGKSMFFSTVACVSNWRAFLMFALTWSLIFAVAAALLGLTSSAGPNPSWAEELVLPVILILASMFFTSAFFSFKDCFTSDVILA